MTKWGRGARERHMHVDVVSFAGGLAINGAGDLSFNISGLKAVYRIRTKPSIPKTPASARAL